MNLPDRRSVLAAAAAFGATAGASAQGSEPIIGNKGTTIIGPRNAQREDQNPNILRPPSTDHGSMPNLRFSFADAHMKIREGGWSREVTQRELAISTTMAGVNMRLTPGGVREMHWHKQAEWSFMLGRQGTHHRRRQRRPQFHCRRGCRRPLVLPFRHPPFDSGIAG
jgi:oxalate decarboxylase